MDNCFDDYDICSEDASQIKKDNINHKFTSYDNLNVYAKSMRAAGNFISDDAKREAQAWLNENSHELPSELYTNDGSARHSKDEWTVSSLNEDEVPELTTDDDDPIGLFFVGNDRLCDRNLHDMADKHAGREVQAAYRSGGLTHDVLLAVKAIRGADYAKRLADHRRRARWLGMEEWDAVAKGDEYLRAGGAQLSVGAESAIDLPSVERLRQVFTVANGKLVWAVSRGRVAKGTQVLHDQVRVDGTLYTTKRVLYKLLNGVDPQSAAVADDLTASDYRSVGLSTERTREDVDNRFDSRVKINGKDITVGTYYTPEQAEEAASIFLRSIERGV